MKFSQLITEAKIQPSLVDLMSFLDKKKDVVVRRNLFGIRDVGTRYEVREDGDKFTVSLFDTDNTLVMAGKLTTRFQLDKDNFVTSAKKMLETMKRELELQHKELQEEALKTILKGVASLKINDQIENRDQISQGGSFLMLDRICQHPNEEYTTRYQLAISHNSIVILERKYKFFQLHAKRKFEGKGVNAIPSRDRFTDDKEVEKKLNGQTFSTPRGAIMMLEDSFFKKRIPYSKQR